MSMPIVNMAILFLVFAVFVVLRGFAAWRTGCLTDGCSENPENDPLGVETSMSLQTRSQHVHIRLTNTNHQTCQRLLFTNHNCSLEALSTPSTDEFTVGNHMFVAEQVRDHVRKVPHSIPFKRQATRRRLRLVSASKRDRAAE
jgi:hypothetical protein